MTIFAERMQRVTAIQMAWVTVAILLVVLLATQNGLVVVALLGYSVWLLVATMRPLTVSTSAMTDTPSAAVFSPMTFITDASISTNDTVDGLVRASQAINEVTLMQADSAREQAQVIQVANARLDDFLAMTERVSDQARLVTRMATQAATISDSGQDAIEQTIVSMDDIRTQVEAIGKTIVRLAELTRRIDDIITSVSEIATQSNLLALNASIEAARAGIHGRGFTAVADEVRVLAGQSTQSAEQVRVILVEIQTAMRDTIKATQQGMQNVETGLTRTQTAQTVMTQLATSVGESRRSIVEISQVLQQQALGMEEISISMDRIQRITQQSLDSTRTVEMVSGNLSRLANDLVTVTG